MKMTPELFDKLLERVAHGEPISKIRAEPEYPSWRTIHKYYTSDPEREKAYREARAAGYQYLAWQALEIADEARGLDMAGVNAARLQVDTRKWLAARGMPADFGDVVNVKHSGSIESLTDEQLDKRIAQLTAKAGAANAATRAGKKVREE